MGTQLAKLRRFTRTPAASLKNVDKVLEKKSISPRHPSTVKAIEEITKANPQFEKKNTKIYIQCWTQCEWVQQVQHQTRF